MAAYVVTARAVQFIVGSRGFLLERGAAVPEGVADEELARLVDRGFITEVEAVEEIVEDLRGDSQGEPAGEPEDADLEKLTKAQLTELATAEDIDLAGTKTNADMVAAITAAQEADVIEEPPVGSDSSNL
jgi:hypothetical protein